MREAPRFDQKLTYVHDTGYRKIRVYRRIDSRMILEDFFSKLALNYRKVKE